MYNVGEAVITPVTELTLIEPPAVFPTLGALPPGLGPEVFDPVQGGFVSMIRVWVLRLPGLLAVIDTGAGNDKPRPASPRFDHLALPFMDRLAAAGVDPAEVDLVINTHLHVDHVGWNTRLENGAWVPTFGRARYVMPRAELPPPALADSIGPILHRPNTLLAEGHEELHPGLTLCPLPGHTPGMVGVELQSGGQVALFVADALHNAVQVLRPDCSSRYCADPLQAEQTRRSLLQRAAASQALVLAAHVGGSGGLRISLTPEGFGFSPV